jgi:hypothetical protein
MAPKRPPSAHNRTMNSVSNQRHPSPRRMTRTPCWQPVKPATADQEYVERKRGLPDGLRVYHGPLTIAGQACAGSLVLPCSTLAGEVVSLQFIPTDGKKLFLPGCKLPPDACLIVGGPVMEGRPIYIVEGIGQAWSRTSGERAGLSVVPSVSGAWHR